MVNIEYQHIQNEHSFDSPHLVSDPSGEDTPYTRSDERGSQ